MNCIAVNLWYYFIDCSKMEVLGLLKENLKIKM